MLELYKHHRQTAAEAINGRTMTTIADLQDKYLAKLATKTKGQCTKRTIRKNLSEFLGENPTDDTLMSYQHFWSSLERAGNALTVDEAQFLFHFWDTRAGQMDPQKFVPLGVAVDDLASVLEEGNQAFGGGVFKSGTDRLDHASAGGNKSNRSSEQGGIFGGGAFEADASRDGYHPAARAPPPVASYSDELAPKPRGNQSSIPGGIFGDQEGSMAPPSSRGDGNKSNRSSVEGGIFATEGPPTMQPRQNKPYSNASSIPGGIFG